MRSVRPPYHAMLDITWLTEFLVTHAEVTDKETLQVLTATHKKKSKACSGGEQIHTIQTHTLRLQTVPAWNGPGSWQQCGISLLTLC